MKNDGFKKKKKKKINLISKSLSSRIFDKNRGRRGFFLNFDIFK